MLPGPILTLIFWLILDTFIIKWHISLLGSNTRLICIWLQNLFSLLLIIRIGIDTQFLLTRIFSSLLTVLFFLYIFHGMMALNRIILGQFIMQSIQLVFLCLLYVT